MISKKRKENPCFQLQLAETVNMSSFLRLNFDIFNMIIEIIGNLNEIKVKSGCELEADLNIGFKNVYEIFEEKERIFKKVSYTYGIIGNMDLADLEQFQHSIEYNYSFLKTMFETLKEGNEHLVKTLSLIK
jgi:hypothetical protein